MLINVDKLKRQPRRIEIDEEAGIFPVLKELANQGTAVFDEKIKGTLTAAWAGDVIDVRGRLKTAATMNCARCLVPVSRHLEIDVQLCYTDSGVQDPRDADDVELESDDLGLIIYSGQEIEMRGDIEQEIIMALPQQVVCDESCRGLCPECGCNLNERQCDCEKPILHAGLAALKDFKVKQ